MPDPLAAVDDVVPALELVVEHARRYLADIRGPVSDKRADAAARSFRGSLPDEGSGTLPAVRQLLEHGTQAHVRSGGPRFFHWVIGGSTPAALAADWFTSPDRPERGRLGHEPACRAARGALARLVAGASFGLPADWGGVLTTGATTANFAALAAARQWWGEQQRRRHRHRRACRAAADTSAHERLRSREFAEGARHAWCRAEADHVLHRRRHGPPRSRGSRAGIEIVWEARRRS